MGGPGTEHTAPTELEEIVSRISDLNKWREIFSFRGLEINNTIHQGLQKLLFGDTTPLFSWEWVAAHFRFRQPHSDLAYALEAGKGGTRAVLMAVQAHIITYLLFTRDTEHTHLERLCQIGQREQGQALAMALAETLWAAGGGGRAVVCLITTAGTVMPHTGYRADTFTERVSMETTAHGAFLKDTFGLKCRIS
ncbi:protein FAM188B2 [Pitangus sulphuratus]|nr:protein FAM188B2 [Pitangus sulphuratus]